MAIVDETLPSDCGAADSIAGKFGRVGKLSLAGVFVFSANTGAVTPNARDNIVIAIIDFFIIYNVN
jgi:hypothetical protein